MPQRKIVDIYYCYAPFMREYRTACYITGLKMAWSNQPRVRSGIAIALSLLIPGVLWHDEKLHGCILSLLLSSQPHTQQITVPRAVDGSVT